MDDEHTANYTYLELVKSMTKYHVLAAVMGLASLILGVLGWYLWVVLI